MSPTSPKWKTDAIEAARLLLGAASPAELRRAQKLLLDAPSRQLARDLKRKWNNLNDGDREEVLIDAQVWFLGHPPKEPEGAYNWLLKKAESLCTDLYRKHNADKRGGGVDIVSMDDDGDDGEDAPGLQIASSDNVEKTVTLQDCIAVKFEAMKADRKAAVHVPVLMMVAEGLDIDDIAVRLGISYTAAKERVSQARKAARPYFEECED